MSKQANRFKRDGVVHNPKQKFEEERQEKSSVKMQPKNNKQKLIKRAQGNSCEGAGIQLLKIERKGSVDYKKVIKDFDIQYDESKYRTDDTSYWSVKVDKEKP